MGTLGTPLEWDKLQLLSIITDGNPEDPPGEGDTTIEYLPEDCIGLILNMVSFKLKSFKIYSDL